MLRLRTFGGLSLEDGPTGGVKRAAQRKRLAFLAVLVANRHRPVTRDKLLGLFWPERPADEARHSLAQLVYALRRDFGDDLLLSGADDLRTNPDALSADVVDFENELDRGNLETAVALYAGPFLDGVFVNDAPEFERWLDTERARLTRRCAGAFESLAHTTGPGAHPDAAGWWRRRVALDPADAASTVALMRALAKAGDRTGAIQHAGVYETLMRSELDAPPDDAVVSLARQLRADASTASASNIPSLVRVSGAAIAPVPAAAAPTPHGVRRRRAMIGIGVLAGAVLATVVLVTRGNTAPPAASALVVLGAVDGPDSALTFAVREALRSSLETDPAIRVLGEARTRETLRLMTRPTDTPLTASVAAEVALRRGASLAIVASATRFGQGIQIVAQVLDPRTGDAVLTASEHPESAELAVPAIARIARRLRARVSKGWTSDREPDDPLPPVMTSSLAALQDYALARRALARFDRDAALSFGEAALEQDSLFPMAHYLVGDLDWFNDRQHESERHLTQALAQQDRLTIRERLLVRARYEQIVADNSDSALVYWQRLHAAYLDDGQAFEGMAWTYRATGRYREAAAAADSALLLDSTTFAPSGTNKMFALIEAGDTTQALAYVHSLPSTARWIGTQARYFTAIRAHDWPRVLNAYPDTVNGTRDPRHPAVVPYHHMALLINGRLIEAAALVPEIRRVWPDHQFTPRAVLAQARAEWSHGGSNASAATASRDALAWTLAADLSAPAAARLAERIAELSARAGDSTTIAAVRSLLETRDAGRKLGSYRLAIFAVDAAAAFARGDMKSAARLAQAARQGMYHGRSLAHLALLEADARAALGDTAAASELYQQLMTADRFAMSDIETWAIFAQEAAARLAK